MALENDQVIEDKIVDEPIEDTIRNAIRGGDEAASVNDTAAHVETAAAKAERLRDEAGRFAETPKDAKRDTLKLPEKATGVKADAPLLGTEQPPVTQPVINAPKGLKPEFKAKFGELSPDWQAEINRREADAAKVLAAQDEDRLFGKTLKEIATPYIPTILAEGGTVEKAVAGLLQTAHVLRQGTEMQKASSVAAVMQQFKVSPQALFSILQGGNVNTGSQAVPGYDPRLETLQQRLDRMEQDRQTEVQQRQLQETQTLQSQIEDFSTKPGHEHFDRVRTHMGVLLENGIAADLDDAYNRAVYADPEIRSTLIAASQQADAGQRQSEAKARAEAARRAGGSVSGGPGSASPLNGSGANVPIEETIRAAIRETSGRIN